MIDAETFPTRESTSTTSCPAHVPSKKVRIPASTVRRTVIERSIKATSCGMAPRIPNFICEDMLCRGGCVNRERHKVK